MQQLRLLQHLIDRSAAALSAKFARSETSETSGGKDAIRSLTPASEDAVFSKS